MKKVLLWAVLYLPAVAYATAEHFYVDASMGNDTANGHAPNRAWKSLHAVNEHTFKAGDVIGFRAGQSWTGLLAPKGSGTRRRSIRFKAYGSGPRPKIVADGRAIQVLLLSNQEYVEVHGLELTASQEAAGKVERGVEIDLNGFGVAHRIRLRDLYVHDIRGSLAAKNTGGIVVRTERGTKPSRYEGLRLERNIIARVDRSGIAFQSAFVDRTKWFPSTGVIIRENYLEDIGGDGIVPWATDHARVEWNTVKRAGMRSADYNAGIWPWSSDNSLLLWNDVSRIGTTHDGEGYDADYNSQNSHFRFNYSHRNRGGMFLVCTPGNANPAMNAGNVGTRIVQNLSYEDEGRVFNISGGSDVRIERNLVVNPAATATQLLILSKWDGWAHEVQVVGNRFLIAGRVDSGHEILRREDGTYVIGPGWGGATDVVMDRNVYATGADVTDPGAHAGSSGWGNLLELDWEGPPFRADSGENLVRYTVAHRRWLRHLMRSAGVK